MGMNLAQALQLLPERFVADKLKREQDDERQRAFSAAFVGAGGKTTAIFQLARQLAAPVIVTATTHLGAWQIPLADQHIIVHSPADLRALEPRGVTLVTGQISEDQRTEGVAEEVLLWLRDMSVARHIPLLIEADGARQKPLKAPAEHEPAIPAFADLVVVVAGLSALGKPLAEEVVHRAEVFSRISGLPSGEGIGTEALARVLVSPEGGCKNIPEPARRVVLLNQADTPGLQAQARGMVSELLAGFDGVVIADLSKSEVQACHERVAGIVLAAGEAKRFGRLKQLLDWRGQPFVRAVARMGLAGGLKPVVVVTGAEGGQVEAALEGLDVVGREERRLADRAGFISAGRLASVERKHRSGGVSP